MLFRSIHSVFRPTVKRHPQPSQHALPFNETVIDGQVVALDGDGKPSFTLLQNYGAAGGSLHYFVFDVLILEGRIHRTIQVSPVPALADIRLVDPPGAIGGFQFSTTSFVQFSCVALHAGPNGGVVGRQTPFYEFIRETLELKSLALDRQHWLGLVQ
jgi:hypothetical protein